MTDLSNSSFIPKQGPVKKHRRSASRKVYFFSLVCYVAFFATLLGSAGVYLYGDLVDRQLKEEIVALNGEIGSFSEINMQRVQEFDVRLQQAYGRLNKSASIVSIFNSLEAATINTVSLNSLSIERSNDEVFSMAVNISTDSFDSTIFQREVYERSEAVESVLIQALQSSGLNGSTGDAEEGTEVSFVAEIQIPLDAVPYLPAEVSEATTQPPAISAGESESETVSSVDSIEVNQNEL